MARELKIKANGIDYNARLITKRLRRRGLEKKNASFGMVFCGILEREARKGKVEGAIRGTFNSVWEEMCGDECSSETYSIVLKGRKDRDYIQLNLTKFIDNYGCSQSYGTMKTRAHWYEQWKEKPLENLSVIRTN